MADLSFEQHLFVNYSNFFAKACKYLLVFTLRRDYYYFLLFCYLSVVCKYYWSLHGGRIINLVSLSLRFMCFFEPIYFKNMELL